MDLRVIRTCDDFLVGHQLSSDAEVVVLVFEPMPNGVDVGSGWEVEEVVGDFILDDGDGGQLLPKFI